MLLVKVGLPQGLCPHWKLVVMLVVTLRLAPIGVVYTPTRGTDLPLNEVRNGMRESPSLHRSRILSLVAIHALLRRS